MFTAEQRQPSRETSLVLSSVRVEVGANTELEASSGWFCHRRQNAATLGANQARTPAPAPGAWRGRPLASASPASVGEVVLQLLSRVGLCFLQR